jgi:SAM-dependent methyltransferase
VSRTECPESLQGFWVPETARLLGLAGVGPGARCLDVGGGTTVMQLMADRAGPTGRVVGLGTDLERGALAAARSGGEFVVGDSGTDHEALPPGGFDLVFGRQVLFEAADPRATLRRMWRWVSPGGCLVVQEYDMRVVDACPSLPATAAWRQAFLETSAAMGRDALLGARLPALFSEAGLGAPDTVDVVCRLGSMTDVVDLLTAIHRAPARATWLSGLAAAAHAEPDRAAMWPLLYGAIKHR